MSEETKKKMSESKKGEKHHLFGKHLPDETKKKISQTLTGKPLEEGARQKLLEYYKTHEPASKGTVLSKEEREKISANKGVFMTFEKAKLIRAEKQNGIKSRDTCNRFNITLSTYYNIVHEKNWVE
jgi:hypothetical protein